MVNHTAAVDVGELCYVCGLSRDAAHSSTCSSVSTWLPQRDGLRYLTTRYVVQTEVSLFHPQMAEAEDLRLSFDLSRGCSQELNLHCR
jgi:hypothetical protein